MKKVSQLKLKTKILLFSLTISVLPLMLVGILSYQSAKKVTDENIDDYTMNITKQIASNIDNYVDQYNQKVREVGFSDAMQNDYIQLATLVNDEAPNIADLINYQTRIETYFYDHLISNKYIGSISFYSEGISTSLSAGIQMPVSDYKEDVYYQKALSNTNEVIWSTKGSLFQNRFGEAFLTVLYPVKNRIYNKNLGVLVMSVSLEELTNKYVDSIDEEGLLYIVDGEGSILSSNMPYMVGEKVDSDIFTQVQKTSDSKDLVIKREMNGVPMHMVIKKLENNDWTVINALSYDVMMESTRNTLIIIVVTSMLLIIAIVLITSYSSRYISVPVRDMTKVMDQVGQGDFSLRIEGTYKDEFNELAIGFNTMLDEIDALRENEKNVYMEMGKAQFLTLQAQINPHFIYNTLDAINWMANIVDADNIAIMITSLANILRFSLDKNMKTTTVEKEIENLDNYIKIQQQRYKNKLNITIDVDAAIKDYRIIKFILQPLVENSIYHAFRGFDAQCMILITGRKVNDTIVLQVADNGLGMDEALLNRYRNKRADNKNGYGLSNIIERLQVYYGESCDLTIESQPGFGTEITMTFPMLLEEVEVWSS